MPDGAGGMPVGTGGMPEGAIDGIIGAVGAPEGSTAIDGIIEEVKVDVGQGVREAEPALRIVNTEQLWIEAYTPTPETIRAGLDKDKPAWVLVDLPDQPRLVEGRILYISPVADSVSQKRRVRVEIVNTEGWPAGTPAKVVFEKPDAKWDLYRVARSTTTAKAGSTN